MHNLIVTHKAIRPTTDAIVDLGQWDRKDFTNLSNTFDLRLVIPASATPGEVGDRRSSASSRASNASTQQHRHFEPQQQQQHRDPDITVITPNDAINDQNGLPPLVSVRRMTQRLAPNLSEQDLDRLAENIIARMQGTITTPPGHGRPNSGESVLGHLEEGVAASSGEEDPPPPWRESWNSSRRGELLER
ncbi:hypothetical protein FRC15_007643 [Serendipita sp. 397]|nr:hypothetical protein FRC15_007643 [Serendipita sp. 397]